MGANAKASGKDEVSARLAALKSFSGPADARGEAERLLELIAGRDMEGALALNAEVAGEWPFEAEVERWFLRKIGGVWATGKGRAQEAWHDAKANVRAKVEIGKPAIIAPPPLLLPRNWRELRIPNGLTELEQLTYVPGLVGDIQEWIVRTAPRPNRMMALGVAGGTIIGRKVRGPRGNATHLYIIILGRSSLGKGHPLKSGDRLLQLLGLNHLVGPAVFASGAGFDRHLAYHPLTICFIDELGDQLRKLKTQQGNDFVTDLKATLKKGHNNWDSWKTAAKVHEDMLEVKWAALSIIAASTWRSYFNAIEGADFESGLTNRFLILPVPYEAKRPPEQMVLPDPPPDELLAALRGLPQSGNAGLIDQPADGLPTLVDLGWTAEASRLYCEFSEEIDGLEETHARGELALKGADNAIRAATIIAQLCGREIDGRDMSWARGFIMESFRTHAGGADRFLREYLEFPEMCDRAYEFYRAAPQMFVSDYKFNRKFGRSQRWGNELGRVQTQLLKEKRIERCEMSESGYGPAAKGCRAIVEDEEEG